MFKTGPKHPNLCQIVGICCNSGPSRMARKTDTWHETCIASEYIAGGSLVDAIPSPGGFSSHPEGALIVPALCGAILAICFELSTLQIFHRDVHCGNLLLRKALDDISCCTRENIVFTDLSHLASFFHHPPSWVRAGSVQTDGDHVMVSWL